MLSPPSGEPRRRRSLITTYQGIDPLFIHTRGDPGDACVGGEAAARDAGFKSIELGATLAGEPFYLARGYKEVSRATHVAANGANNVVIRMVKAL